MTTPIEEGLLRYFAVREQQHANRRQTVLDALTDQERALVREAAVMGYVRGSLTAPHRPQIPSDQAIVAEVVDACLAMPDLYPTLAGLEAGPEQETMTP
jgi:hypothetical protein